MAKKQKPMEKKLMGNGVVKKGSNNASLQLRERSKRNVKAEKWDVSALEMIAHKCKLICNSRTLEDWDLFLLGIYEAVKILGHLERSVLLMHQEFSIPRKEIARVIGMKHSTIDYLYKEAVEKVVAYMKNRNMLRKFENDDYVSPAIRKAIFEIEGDLTDDAQIRQRIFDGIISSQERTNRSKTWRCGRAEERAEVLRGDGEKWKNSYVCLPRKSVERGQRVN